MHFQILNFGSLNIDHVYQVDHFVAPGQTLSADGYTRNAGGKGLNQSIALAHAGVKIAHAGKIGTDGMFLRDTLAAAGVNTDGILTGDTPTGHACIQVDRLGQNSILLYPGANHALSESEISQTLDNIPADLLLLQNETSMIPFLMREAVKRGMKIAINPAPCNLEVRKYPLELADILIVNEIEAAQLAEINGTPENLADHLTRRFPRAEVVMTLGAMGALYAHGKTERHFEPALPVKPIDTTCAGDTFIGFFLSMRMNGADIAGAMNLAARASAITVTRPGAANSIPSRKELV